MAKGAIIKKGVQKVSFNSFVMMQFSYLDQLCFPAKKHIFVQKSNVHCFWTVFTDYFVKWRPATFFRSKKVNLTFIPAKEVFFNVVIFNVKKVGRIKKETLKL